MIKIESCSHGPYFELFARFARPDWKQWENKDVEENSFYGLAKRNGHADEQLRLFKSPKGYAIR